jgi:hypothetical protein
LSVIEMENLFLLLDEKFSYTRMVVEDTYFLQQAM